MKDAYFEACLDAEIEGGSSEEPIIYNSYLDPIQAIIGQGLEQIEIRTNFGVNAPDSKTARWGFLILGKHKLYPDFFELECQEGELLCCGCEECKLYGTDLPDIESVFRALSYVAKNYGGVRVRVHAHTKSVAFMSHDAESYVEGFHDCPVVDGLFTNFKKLYMESFQTKGIDVDVVEDLEEAAPLEKRQKGKKLNVENK